MRMLRLLLIGLALAGARAAAAGSPAEATGIVYEDANGNGRRDPGEAGLPRIRVSNGREIARTDNEGHYRLPVTDDTILFVIKPAGWMTPVSRDCLPRFYYVHKAAGSPRNEKSPYPGVAPTGPLPTSVDFPLHQRAEPERFDVLVFGDTQVDDLNDVGYLSRDLVAELVGTTAAFGVTLGDLVNDKPSLHEPLAQVIGGIGVPWYNVLGNHDRNYFAGEQRYFDESFERVFGPAHYAFEYGPVSFLVLADIRATGDENYVAGLGETQLDFIGNYLAEVPQEALVVLMAHIPLGELPQAERRRLFDLLEPRPNNLVLTAHNHVNEHTFLGAGQGWNGAAPLHQLINVTACGCWWHGSPDETGIPHATMADGAPNGYSVVTFDRGAYSIRFKAARWPADYQMSVHAPDEVSAGAAAPVEVLVNVFAGSPRSVVEMRIGDSGAWVRLEQVRRPDPAYVRMKQLEESKTPPPGKKLPKANDCPHLWRGELPTGLPPGVHVLRVRTMDMFGQTYEIRRIVRVNAGATSRP